MHRIEIQRASFWCLVVSLALTAACGSGDGPTGTEMGPGTLTISAATAGQNPEHGSSPDGGWRIECAPELIASALDAEEGTVFRWSRATIHWRTAFEGRPAGTTDLSTEEVVDIWGSPTLAAGDSLRRKLRVWNDRPFRMQIEFRYSPDGASGSNTESVDYRCEPPARPLEGSYLLTSINETRVPAYGVIADTFEFFPDMTYRVAGSWVSGRDTLYGSSPPEPYRILSADSLRLPTLRPHVGGGGFSRSGTTLRHHQNRCCGRESRTWRFDKEGSNPSLPEEPSLVLSTDSVNFEVPQGADPPERATIDVTSSTSTQISGISWRGTCSSVNGIGCSEWQLIRLVDSRTPTTLEIEIYETDLPPDTYTSRIELESDAAANSPAVVQVVLTVTAP